MTRPRTVWDQGVEPGRQVLALGLALALSALWVDLLLSERPGWVFDIGFLLLCPVLALRVRPQDFFAVAVAPPLLMLALFVAISAIEPAAIARADDGLTQATLTGMAEHSAALFFGYAGCLLCLEVRRRRLGAARF